MKRLGLIIAVMLLLIIGGALTTQLVANGDAGLLPVLRQSANPDASVNDMVGWKAEQFFLAIGFILFNLVGMALTIALIVWFLDRGIRQSRAEAGAPAKSARTE